MLIGEAISHSYTYTMSVTNSKHGPPSHDAIRTALAPFGVVPTPTLCEQVRVYLRILVQWTDKINLTSIREPLEILARHFGESMFAAFAVPIEHGRLADVGSGAGFPGLPLKLIRPDLDLTLIEPNIKKSAFLSEVVRALELTDVTVLRSTFADSPIKPVSLTFITSRALDPSEGLLPWAHRSLAPGGRVVLWTAKDTAQEICADVHWNWLEPISIPQSKQRVLLVGQPL